MAGDLTEETKELRRAVYSLTSRVDYLVARVNAAGERADMDALSQNIIRQKDLIRLALAASDPARQHALLLDMARLWELPEARGTAPGGNGPDDS
jgi:hypothetical protein